jgi:hypothetical protein
MTLLEPGHQIGLQQTSFHHPAHVSAHRGKATARARHRASPGFVDQPVEKPLFVQDQLAACGPVIASTEIS